MSELRAACERAGFTDVETLIASGNLILSSKIAGEKLEKNIDTGFKWYDKTNVDSPEMKPLLYD